VFLHAEALMAKGAATAVVRADLRDAGDVVRQAGTADRKPRAGRITAVTYGLENFGLRQLRVRHKPIWYAALSLSVT
jgi:hypothetical protein